MHHRYAIAAIAAATLTLAGCSSDNGGDDEAKATPQGTAGAVTAPAAPTTPAAKQPPAPVALGQPVKLTRPTGSGIEMTAVQVLDPAPTTKSKTLVSVGAKLVAVQWKITASGTMAITSSPAYGSVVIDEQGQEYRLRSGTSDAGPEFPLNVSIGVGDTRTGWTLYEMAPGAKIAKIQFAPGGLGSAADTATWTL